MDKDLNRHKHATWILFMVFGLAIALVVLAATDKLTAEFNLALGTLLAYAGNHTYQNYRTNPKEIK